MKVYSQKHLIFFLKSYSENKKVRNKEKKLMKTKQMKPSKKREKGIQAGKLFGQNTGRKILK
jgi:hypothetical protein